MRAGCIVRDAFVQRLGDLLAVAVAAEFLLIGGTAYEGNFRQNSGHRCLGENYVRGFFHAAVAQPGIVRR